MPGVSNESPARMPAGPHPPNGSGPAPAGASAAYNRAPPGPAAYQTMPNPRSAQPIAQPPPLMSSTLPRPPEAVPRQVGRAAVPRADPNAVAAGQDQLDAERIDGRRALRCTIVLLDGSELFVSVLVCRLFDLSASNVPVVVCTGMRYMYSILLYSRAPVLLLRKATMTMPSRASC